MHQYAKHVNWPHLVSSHEKWTYMPISTWDYTPLSPNTWGTFTQKQLLLRLNQLHLTLKLLLAELVNMVNYLATFVLLDVEKCQEISISLPTSECFSYKSSDRFECESLRVQFAFFQRIRGIKTCTKIPRYSWKLTKADLSFLGPLRPALLEICSLWIQWKLSRKPTKLCKVNWVCLIRQVVPRQLKNGQIIHQSCQRKLVVWGKSMVFQNLSLRTTNNRTALYESLAFRIYLKVMFIWRLGLMQTKSINQNVEN